MRVRYQMVGEAGVAVCDLSDKEAKKLYANIKRDGLCEWAELVGEDEENYMEIIESFDHIAEARRVAWHLSRF